jgi:hypothetical protein
MSNDAHAIGPVCPPPSHDGMARRVSSIMMAALALLSLSACINIRLVNVGQKTAFERQLVGTYEELDGDLALVSSMRGESAKILSPATGTDLKARAMAARRRQLFNRDDIVELKRQGCLAENNAGVLEGRPCDATKNDEVAKRNQRMLAQENEDREAIIELAVQLDTSLTPADIPALHKVYAQLMRSQAEKGMWVQQDDNSWEQIK